MKRTGKSELKEEGVSVSRMKFTKVVFEGSRFELGDRLLGQMVTTDFRAVAPPQAVKHTNEKRVWLVNVNASRLNLQSAFNPYYEMRSLILATLIVFSSIAASGQANINKGDWMIGGSAGLSSYKEGDYKVTTLQLSPDFGYFFIDRFAAGLRTDLSFYKWAGQQGHSSELLVNPFVRYYFLPSSQKVNVFAEGSAGVGQRNQKGNNPPRYTTNQYAIKAGPAIFLTPSTALEIALGYTSKHKQYSDWRSQELALTIEFQVHIPGSKR